MPTFQVGGSVNWAGTGAGSYSTTFTASGTDRCVVIFVATDRTARSILSATYGGTAMTAFGAQVANNQAECNVRGFYLAGDSNVPTGSQTIEVTFDSSGFSINPCMAIGCWDGVDSTTPQSGYAITDCSSGGNTTTLSATVTSATGDLVIGLAQQGFPNSSNPTFTGGTGTTAQFHADHTTGTIRSLSVFDEAGASSVTFGGTQSPSARAQMLSCSLKAVSSASGAPATNKFMMGVG